MMLHEKIIARKYAIAWLRLYYEQITPLQFDALQLLQQELQTYREKISLVMLVHRRAPEERFAFLLAVVARHGLDTLLKSLIKLLLQEKRIHLFEQVVITLCQKYRELSGIMNFCATSAHQLSAEQQEQVRQMLERITGKHISMTALVDPTLIAGLRLQSDTLLWEYSVRKLVRSCTLSY